MNYIELSCFTWWYLPGLVKWPKLGRAPGLAVAPPTASREELKQATTAEGLTTQKATWLGNPLSKWSENMGKSSTSRVLLYWNPLEDGHYHGHLHLLKARLDQECYSAWQGKQKKIAHHNSRTAMGHHGAIMRLSDCSIGTLNEHSTGTHSDA